ncbi:hypothetical protein [Chthonomonas calidirosea]|uniref:HEAT repeat n=1 Tax=Chthonomonas calidirosea (strain DSM 23976 / ICMP 18418 / T49) TaxID=1303518 RepID=S0EX83_CHTCT|nr:hypothetical protein [Chthonomonas calidirosea]CCW36337.1 hypothetical protein CCALI_02542 [Chthonomonas calidirosea T49]CEK16567.1 hypothetical protein CP488_01551 [Chthonomonas calidirosea]CEK17633.1 hypothetical protein CTKA_01550 [Chthonomonas calidirosea]
MSHNEIQEPSFESRNDTLHYPHAASQLDPVERSRVESLLQKVRASSPIRQAIERFLADPSHAPLPIEPFKDALKSPKYLPWRRAEQQLAVWGLVHTALTPENREEVVSLLIHVLIGQHNKALRALLIGSIAILFIAVVFSLYHDMVLVLDFSLSSLATFLLTCNGPVPYADAVREEASHAVVQLKALEALDALAPRVILSMRALVKIEITTLFSLLPALTSAHYGTVAPRTLSCLAWLLSEEEEEAKALLLLEALEKVGDQSVLPIIRQLANGKDKLGKFPSVQQKAASVQRHIEERLAKQKEAETLLRVASHSSSSTLELLRPARTDPEQEALVLLRAAMEKETEQALVLAVLDDLKRCGDKRAIPLLQQLLLLPNLAPAVQSAASDCLQTLQAHEETM